MKAVDSEGIIGTQTYTFIAYPTLTATIPSIPILATGAIYSSQWSAQGGFGYPYNFSVIGGTVPAGLSITNNGLLSGTPTTPGTTSLKVLVEDAFGFDINETVPITVAVDTTLPTSHVANLPTYSPATFTVNWSGSTTGPAGAIYDVSIASYNVYVSDNGGAFKPLLMATTQTSASFTGVDGHTYAFYTVATDSLGHTQTTPTTGQTSTLVDATAPTSQVGALPTECSTAITLHWSGSDIGSSGAAGSGIVSYTIYASVNGGSFAPIPSLTGTTQTSAMYTGTVGSTYAFYSVAKDAVGNVQATPSTGQATTKVGTLKSITLTPPATPNPTVASGQTQQFTATGTFSDGSTANLNSQVSWSAVPSTVATISATGLAMGIYANTAVIKAILGGVEGDSSLLVSGLASKLGKFSGGNLALAAGVPGATSNPGTAFAQNVQTGFSIAALNDNKYGDSSAWVSSTQSSFAGISFGSTMTTICGIAWSSDNTGSDQNHSVGTYTLQFTTMANPGANTPNSSWTSIGSVTYSMATYLQHVYAFAPIQVTGIRLETISASTSPSSFIGIDELQLYAQSPLFVASDGSDYILGTAGNDDIYLDASRNAFGTVIPNSVTVTFNNTGTWGPFSTNGLPVTIFGYGGNDTITVDLAFSGATRIIGGGGNDTITGGGGNDYIDGGGGDTIVIPSPGDDTIVHSSGISIFGDAGNNNIALSWEAGVDSSQDVLVESINGRTNSMNFTPVDNNPNLTITVVGGLENNIVYMGAVPAGNFTTVFYGGPKANLLAAGPNNSSAILVGGSGTNDLLGGGGLETIIGGSGTNVIYGGTGTDYIYGGSGINTIHGSSGTDTIIAGTGKTTIIAGSGPETILGITALDTIQPGIGPYSVTRTSLPASGYGVGIDAFLAMVYTEELNRLPDASGLHYYGRQLAKGESSTKVVATLASSKGHKALVAAGLVTPMKQNQVLKDALAAEARAKSLAASLAHPAKSSNIQTKAGVHVESKSSGRGISTPSSHDSKPKVSVAHPGKSKSRVR